MSSNGPSYAPQSPLGPTMLSLRLDATEAAVSQALASTKTRLEATLDRKETCHHAEIVLAEALNNVVEHAFQARQSGAIDVDIWIEDDLPIIEIRDQGRAMPGGTLPAGRMPEFDPDDVHRLPEGGFGWALLHRLTSDISYRREGDLNILHLRLAAPPSPPL